MKTTPNLRVKTGAHVRRPMGSAFWEAMASLLFGIAAGWVHAAFATRSNSSPSTVDSDVVR